MFLRWAAILVITGVIFILGGLVEFSIDLNNIYNILRNGVNLIFDNLHIDTKGLNPVIFAHTMVYLVAKKIFNVNNGFTGLAALIMFFTVSFVPNLIRLSISLVFIA